MFFSLASHLGEYSPYFAAFGAIYGAYLACKFLISLWDGVKTFCLAKLLRLTVDFKSTGSWAVITGATDGIGKEFSRELARRGLNIVFISRNLDKLHHTASLIETEFKVQTRCIEIDFTHNFSIYNTVKEQLQETDVGVLFNNVGLMYEVPDHFLRIQGGRKMMADMVNVNCLASVMMTRIVLPGMIKRGRGVIINNGSGSGVRPLPLFTLYSATKAFSDYFTLGLLEECRQTKVIIQVSVKVIVAVKQNIQV